MLQIISGLKGKKLVSLLTFFCLFIASISFAHGGYLLIKAQLAQYLLAQAWQQQILQQQTSQHQIITDSAQKNKPIKPWPWADIYPVAKISFDRFNVSQIVLNNDSGQALAFGPGLFRGDMMNNENLSNNAYVISAHNDTHFTILEKLVLNDSVTITLASGVSQTLRVDNISIIDTQTEQLVLLNNDSVKEQGESEKFTLKELILVTCYPFGGISNQTSLRYIVHLS